MNTKNLVILAFLAAILGLFVACGKSADSKLITVSGATLAEKLEWLASNAASNTSYLLKISAAHEELAPYNLSYFGSNITIQLKGIGKERVVSFSNNGSLFTVNNGVTLILDNITLTGASGNNNALVRVNSGGSLQLNKDVKISGNSGSGVYNNGGTITMTGGEISGNKGGGVRNDVTYTSIDGEYVTIIGTFTMSGGKISGNTSSSFDGGGVYNNGIFTMSGGEISDNTGGGMHNNGTFTMSGGKISGNTSSSFDGGGVHNGVIYTMVDGVYVAINGIFTMTGGEISDNTSSYGGGVSNYGNFTMEDGKISGNTCFIGGGVDNHGTLTMKGGTISGNNAFFYGGGMSNSVTYTYTYDGYISEGMFTMTGGEISGNTASSYGGGVVVGNEAVLFKTGGTITGYTEGDGNSNVVKNDSGVVQNDQGHSVYAYHDDDAYIKQKETTDGPGDVLLSYNGKFDPPVWSGDWDN
jgi:hypothetical protein